MPDPNTINPSATPAADAASPQPSAGAAEASSPAISLDDIAKAVEAAFAKREQTLVAGVSSLAAKVEADAATWWDWARDKLRASPLLLFFVVAFFFVVSMNEAKVGLTLWGISRVGLFAWMGYWNDRIIFGRLKGLSGIELGTAWKRRAIIVAATLISGAMLP